MKRDAFVVGELSDQSRQVPADAETVTVHVRWITSDYDGDHASGHLFDNDRHDGARRAYSCFLNFENDILKLNPKLDWDVACKNVRADFERISGNYWRDLDHDERKRAPQIKAEAIKLVKPLEAAIKILERAPYVGHAIDAEIRDATTSLRSDRSKDPSISAVSMLKSLLQASQKFTESYHRKSGGTVRFKNASHELSTLWTNVTQKRFSRNARLTATADPVQAKGRDNDFEYIGAQFVFLTLNAIGTPIGDPVKGWVKPSQVQEALKSLWVRGK